MGTPQEPTGIVRFFKELRFDPRTNEWLVPRRDVPRGFTTISFDLGATAAQLYTLIGAGGAATIHASAQGICYAMVICNDMAATSGTVTIWEGTASVRKLKTRVIAGDVQEFRGVEETPVLKWQPGKTLQARHAAGGKLGGISISMCYWAEEP